MNSLEPELEHPKKRRRRDVARPLLSARLVFDDRIKADAVVVSKDLWLTLTGHHDASSFLALTPKSPLAIQVQDSTWTVVAARPKPAADATAVDDAADALDVITISPSSSNCQSLLKIYAQVDRDRHPGQIPKSIDVRVTPTTPLTLDTVYVSVEKGLLEKVDEIQNKFGGGFQSGKPARADKRSQAANAVLQNVPALTSRLSALVREALSHLPIVHTGDVFALPLPAHPITHVRPPPAIVLECEPVSQGQIAAATKIVLIQTGSSQEKALQKLTSVQPIIEESLEDTAEDTSNDQFFSAAEDRHTEAGSDGERSSDPDSDSDRSAHDESDPDSDSMDDMISLSAPGLPPQQAGTLSAMTSATPRPGGKRATGTHTPGSLYSSFTSATTRTGNRPGKVFRTEALLRHVPHDLLHPKPGLDDDDESFVFVDTGTLAKIGCFSGDWVRIEIARNVTSQGLVSAAIKDFGAFGADDESDWRTVKIFGLSGLSNQQPRYAVDKTGDRRSSFTHRDLALPMSPVLCLSPILLANLSNAPFVKVGALPVPPRAEPRSLQVPRAAVVKAPPLAREVHLSKISDPTTTDPTLQSTLFSSLKHFLETKKRTLKKGDLLGVPVDRELGQVLASPRGAADETPRDEESDTITRLNRPEGAGASRYSIAWFSVQQVDVDLPNGVADTDHTRWGGVVTLDSTQARVSQSGSSIHTVSHATELWARYWCGIRRLASHSVHRVDHIPTAADIPATDRLPLEKRLSGLITAAVSNRAISLGVPPLVILLHSAQRQIGKSYIANAACGAVGVHTFPISVYDLLSENASTTGGGDVKTEALLRTRAERALAGGAQQTALLIQHIDALTADRMIPALQDIISWSRVLIATTTKIDDIPAGVRSLFSHEFEVAAPDEMARELILRNACLSSSTPLASAINLKSIALQTAALVAGDLLDVVNRASLARYARLLALADAKTCELADVYIAGGQGASHLLSGDFGRAIAAARSTFSDAIGAPKIPTVTWQDVGGLSSQKDAITETISLPLTHPELFANGIRKRSGILFYGPPGTGKTLLAKAIATEFSLNFFSVKGPELLNMYIGESEANVRRVFQRARDARPCVVFFDELDSVAPKRGNQGDSGGVMDRIVSQLLAELDGMSSGGGSSDDANGTSTSNAGGVFVIGATNRPDLLDPALLRPGRFDKMLYLGVADSHDSQVTILEALTRKFTLAPDVDLTRVANRLPFTYTGADLYALCSDAMLKAITRKTKMVDEKVQQISKVRNDAISTAYFFDHLATEEDVQVIVNEADFSAAQHELVGSVSKKELEHFERIRNLFEEQDITVPPKPSNSVHPAAAATSRASYPEMPFRPPPPIPVAEAPPTEPSPPPSGTGQRPLHPPRSDSLDFKGKGKGKAIPHLNTFSPDHHPAPISPRSQSFARIGNPDSEASSDGEDFYGGGMGHVNGTAVNGTKTNSDIKGKSKLKSKGKGRAMTPPVSNKLDGFIDGVEGDDEGLYDE